MINQNNNSTCRKLMKNNANPVLPGKIKQKKLINYLKN